MLCAVTLVQSILPAVLSYASECWIGGTKEILSKLEQSFKQMIYSIFGFGEKTKYSAVMLELGLMKMKHVVARSNMRRCGNNDIKSENISVYEKEGFH